MGTSGRRRKEPAGILSAARRRGLGVLGRKSPDTDFAVVGARDDGLIGQQNRCTVPNDEVSKESGGIREIVRRTQRLCDQQSCAGSCPNRGPKS